MKNSNIDLDKVKDLITFLNDLIEDRQAECAIVAETSYDESGIIGTDDAYLMLAKTLLEFVFTARFGLNYLDDVEIDEFKKLDDKPFFTNEVKYVFDELADVWPVVAYLCENKQSMKRICDWLKPRL